MFSRSNSEPLILRPLIPNAVDLIFRPAQLFPRAVIANVKSKTALRPICSSFPSVLPFAKEFALNANARTRTLLFGAPWAFRGTDRATARPKASRIFRIQASVLRRRPCLHLLGAESARYSLQSL